MNGKFIISLDFELYWGVFDKIPVLDYQERLSKTRMAIDSMLELSDTYEVRLTFATVGFLFAQTKEELTNFVPSTKPTYTDHNLNPYPLLESIGSNEDEEPFYYAKNTVQELAKDKRHEIGTHTFSHYYCREKGQTIEQFNADLVAAKKIARSQDIDIKSIVFPRNQVNQDYLDICVKNGITSYRGTEKAVAYNPEKRLPEGLKKVLRFLDSYMNVFGYHTVSDKELRFNGVECLNLPSSRFLRPFNNKLRLFEPLKVKRIEKAMTYAARNGHLYHLWWHPHNFGKNLEGNIKNLESIYAHFQKLKQEYNFESETMTSLATKVSSHIF